MYSFGMFKKSERKDIEIEQDIRSTLQLPEGGCPVADQRPFDLSVVGGSREQAFQGVTRYYRAVNLKRCNI